MNLLRELWNRPVVFLALMICAVMTGYAQRADEKPTQAEVDRLRREAIDRRLRHIVEEKVLSREPYHRMKAEPGGRLPLSVPPSRESMVSEANGSEGEIHAAVNPIDTNNIVVCAIKSGQGGFTLPIHYSRDFGRTWKTSSFVARGQSGGDPIFVFDPKGTLYFSWIEFNFLSQSETNLLILAAPSTDGGETWGTADTIIRALGKLELDSTQGFRLTGEMADKQWMAADFSQSQYRNTVYAVFLELNANGGGIVVRKKRGDSATFERRSTRVSGVDFIDMQFSSISVDQQGKVHVFFWGSKAQDRPGLWHSVSADGGESFSTPTRIANTRFPVADPNERIPAYLPQRIQTLPQFAIDNHVGSEFQGNMYAVWCSNDLEKDLPGTFDEPLNVYFSSSSDGGASWSSPARVHGDVPTFRADHFHPSIDVSPSGAVVVTWYDGRAAENNTKVDHYTAFSFDGGGAFVNNIPVSSRPSNIDAGIQGQFGIGDYTKVVSTSGYAIPLWADGRENDGDLNIYAAFVPLSPDAGGTSGVERTVGVGGNLGIIGVRPHPAVDRTEIRYRLEGAAWIRVELVDVRGEVVKTIWEGSREAGEHSVELDCSDLPSGWYFCRVSTASASVVHRVLIER